MRQCFGNLVNDEAQCNNISIQYYMVESGIYTQCINVSSICIPKEYNRSECPQYIHEICDICNKEYPLQSTHYIIFWKCIVTYLYSQYTIYPPPPSPLPPYLQYYEIPTYIVSLSVSLVVILILLISLVTLRSWTTYTC